MVAGRAEETGAQSVWGSPSEPSVGRAGDQEGGGLVFTHSVDAPLLDGERR